MVRSELFVVLFLHGIAPELVKVSVLEYVCNFLRSIKLERMIVAQRRINTTR